MFNRLVFSVLFLVTLGVGTAQALESPKEELEHAGVVTQLGNQIDLGLIFKDSSGKEVKLGELTKKGKPFFITPVYYDCPRICGLLLTNFTKLLSDIKLEFGQDFSVITVSFDPKESSDLAAIRLRKFHDLYRNPVAADGGWPFLVGEKTNIDILMKSLGFNFLKDGTEYAHAPVFMILTPEGKISQYFTGITFSPWDVRLALVEASEGRIGSPIDHFLLFCFRFDPTKGRYSWAAWNFLRIGSILSVVLCGLIVFIYSRKTN